MQVLLDECLPRRLAATLVGHDVTTVPEQGWSGAQNGALLALASRAGFDAFITIDQHLVAQPQAESPPMVIVVLRAKSSRLQDLEPLATDVLLALADPTPRVIHVGN